MCREPLKLGAICASQSHCQIIHTTTDKRPTTDPISTTNVPRSTNDTAAVPLITHSLSLFANLTGASTVTVGAVRGCSTYE